MTNSNSNEYKKFLKDQTQPEQKDEEYKQFIKSVQDKEVQLRNKDK